MSASAGEAIEHLTDTVDYLRISTGPPPPADGDWLACDALVGDTEALGAVVRSTMAGRGTDRDDVAMSLFVQGYAFRIASISIGSWLLDDVVVDVSPANTSIAMGRHRPNAVRLRESRLVDSDDGPLTTLHRHLVDDHLALLVATAHEVGRIGEALLWSNIGSACASSFGAFMAPLPDRTEEIRNRFERFLATARPELAGSGTIVPVGPMWAWERRACCLWYKTESGFRCEDCSLWTDDERQARYQRVLEGMDA